MVKKNKKTASTNANKLNQNSDTQIGDLNDSVRKRDFGQLEPTRRYPQPDITDGVTIPSQGVIDITHLYIEMDMTFTRITEAIVDGKPVLPSKYRQVSWASVIEAVIVYLVKKEKVKRDNVANLAFWNRIDIYLYYCIIGKGPNHFRYIEDIDVSIRKMDANDTFDALEGLARKFKFPLKFKFYWDNKNLEFAGREGIFDLKA